MPPPCPAHRTAILFGLALLAGSAAAASAQPLPPDLADAALERFITDVAHRGCDLGDFRAVHRGPLAGIDGPVVIAAYDIEGCAGGNNSAQLMGVFRIRGGAIELIRPPLAKPISVETARLRDGRIIVEGLRWSPEDARCCPSVPVTLAFRMRDGALVADQVTQ